MSRIACLRIPQFQIAVHQKHEPDLKGKAFVVLDSTSMTDNGRAKIFMPSELASQKQIVPGMKLSEAKAIYANLIWRKYDKQLYQDTQKKLVKELLVCSPKITIGEPGIFLLDASGLSHFGGETTFCRNLLKVISKAGFTNTHIGIADSAFAAEVAARLKNKRWHVVPAGQDRSVLEPLSIWHLPVSFAMKEALTDLGIKTMGQLLAIPVPDLIERFGLEALLATNLAQGLDKREPMLPEEEKHFECSVDLGGPMESLNETLFVLKSMVDRLLAQLKQEGLVPEELHLSFYNDNDKFDERPVKLLRPSDNNKFLVEVLKLSLEAKPLIREYTAVTLAVSRWTNALWEQTEIETISSKPATDELSSALLLMLQRFNTRLGPLAVMRPVANDQYLPELAGIWMPVLDTEKQHAVLPLNTNYLKVYINPNQGVSANLVLKKHKTPHPILVKLEGSLPKAIAYQGQWFHVKQITIPDCLSGMWWDKAVYRSYYMAVVQSQYKNPGDILVLLTQQYTHGHSSWFMEGYYD